MEPSQGLEPWTSPLPCIDDVCWRVFFATVCHKVVERVWLCEKC